MGRIAQSAEMLEMLIVKIDNLNDNQNILFLIEVTILVQHIPLAKIKYFIKVGAEEKSTSNSLLFLYFNDRFTSIEE